LRKGRGVNLALFYDELLVRGNNRRVVMRSRWFTGWEYYVFGPIVVVLVSCALWISFSAAHENYRLAQANAQLYNIIGTVREMRVPQDAVPERALKEFYRRLSESQMAQVVQVLPPFLGKEAEQGLQNPWGEVVRVYLYPSVQSVRIEMPVSSSVCRNMLLFAAEKSNILRLRRVDVKENDAIRVWRILYEEGRDKKLTTETIYGGCGDNVEDVLSLTFYL